MLHFMGFLLAKRFRTSHILGEYILPILAVNQFPWTYTTCQIYGTSPSSVFTTCCTSVPSGHNSGPGIV